MRWDEGGELEFVGMMGVCVCLGGGGVYREEVIELSH